MNIIKSLKLSIFLCVVHKITEDLNSYFLFGLQNLPPKKAFTNKLQNRVVQSLSCQSLG